MGVVPTLLLGKTLSSLVLVTQVSSVNSGFPVQITGPYTTVFFLGYEVQFDWKG